MTAAQVAQQKKAFLQHFRAQGNVTKAAEAAGVARRTAYNWQEHDDQFAAAFRDAEIEATETLEAEAHRRAALGVPKGKVVTEAIRDEHGAETGLHTVRREESIEYSDTLLIFLLKARAPDKYRERHDVTSGGQPLQAAHADLDTAIERRLALLAAGGQGAHALAADGPPQPADT